MIRLSVKNDQKEEVLAVYLNKEDIMRVLIETVTPEQEVVEGGEVKEPLKPFRQMTIVMKYKVKDFRKTYKMKGDIVQLNNGQPIIVTKEIEDFDVYHIREESEIQRIEKELSV